MIAMLAILVNLLPKGVEMRKTMALALVAATTLTAVAQNLPTASLVVTNCCESKVDTLLLPKLNAVLATKLSKIGLQTVNPDFFKDKAEKAHGRVTVSVWQLQESKSNAGLSTRNHRYSIRMEINLTDAQNGASVCGGVEVNTNSSSYSASQVANHGQKYIDELIDAAAADCARQWKDNPEFRKWIESPPSQKPLPPGPKYPYEPLVLSDVENAINVLRGKMLEDGKFNDRCNELFAQRGGSPVLTVGGINDLTKGKTPCAKLGEYVDLAKGRIQTTLGKTHRFAIKDFTAVEELRPYIKNTDKDPLSDRSLLEALQRHLQPDLFVAGHIKYISESGIGTYYIHLGAYDFLKGVVIWEDDVEVVKTLPRGGAR